MRCAVASVAGSRDEKITIGSRARRSCIDTISSFTTAAMRCASWAAAGPARIGCEAIRAAAHRASRRTDFIAFDRNDENCAQLYQPAPLRATPPPPLRCDLRSPDLDPAQILSEPTDNYPRVGLAAGR